MLDAANARSPDRDRPDARGDDAYGIMAIARPRAVIVAALVVNVGTTRLLKASLER